MSILGHDVDADDTYNTTANSINTQGHTHTHLPAAPTFWMLVIKASQGITLKKIWPFCAQLLCAENQAKDLILHQNFFRAVAVNIKESQSDLGPKGMDDMGMLRFWFIITHGSSPAV